MAATDYVVETIRRCRLDIEPEELSSIATPVFDAISGLDLAQKNAVLLLLERSILEEQGGHRLTVKFGHSDAANNPPCIICRRDIDAEDWSLRMISRWENTQLWITWHGHCVEDGEFEIEYNVLTGQPKSPVGYI